MIAQRLFGQRVDLFREQRHITVPRLLRASIAAPGLKLF